MTSEYAKIKTMLAVTRMISWYDQAVLHREIHQLTKSVDKQFLKEFFYCYSANTRSKIQSNGFVVWM